MSDTICVLVERPAVGYRVVSAARVVEVGWPWRAFEGRWEWLIGRRPAPPTGTWAKVLRYEYFEGGEADWWNWTQVAYRPAPLYRPRPFALLGNTLFYSALLMAALWVYYRAVRWHRRRRKLCVACAYDFSGAASGACPECGHLSGNGPDAGRG